MLLEVVDDEGQGPQQANKLGNSATGFPQRPSIEKTLKKTKYQYGMHRKYVLLLKIRIFGLPPTVRVLRRFLGARVASNTVILEGFEFNPCFSQ